MVSLGEVSARLFGADPVLRGYLRHALAEDGEAGAGLFGRLLGGAGAELERLSRRAGGLAAVRLPQGAVKPALRHDGNRTGPSIASAGLDRRPTRPPD
ncbi:hypothetical protein ACHZ98_17805 [Streptomyces sp. MAR4 CNY-716]